MHEISRHALAAEAETGPGVRGPLFGIDWWNTQQHILLERDAAEFLMDRCKAPQMALPSLRRGGSGNFKHEPKSRATPFFLNKQTFWLIRRPSADS